MVGSDFPKLYRETWAVYEAFRRLGFRHEEVFVTVADSVQMGPNVMHVLLRAQNKEFLVYIDKIDRAPEEVAVMWNKLKDALADGSLSDDEINKMWKSSFIGQDVERLYDLAYALKQKGFYIPLMLRKLN